MNKLIFIILGISALKAIMWARTVPVFQTPDEQAHFAQLSYIAENKTLTVAPVMNLSEEIAIVEELLGTRRDGQGNNNYTYHPEYKNRSAIPSLSITSRTTYVDRESAGYPPLYYILDLPFYYLSYQGNVGDRVMASRTLSVICNLLLVVCAFFIGRIVWEDNLKSLVLAVMVGFQPMVSFVSAGIHPDNLLNLIYSVGVLVCLLILKNGVKVRYLGALAIIAVLGIETKQLMFLFLPIAAAAVVNNYLVLLIPVLAFVFRWPVPYMPADEAYPLTLIDYLKFRIPKLTFEMWPWFWGVFKWLGVTLPAIVMKIITRVAAVAGIVILLKFRKNTFERKALIFFLFSIVSYIVYLFLWDWRLMQALGYSQGLQGRYLFPNIVPIMAIFVMAFGRFSWLLGAGMIVLNGFTLWFISNLY